MFVFGAGTEPVAALQAKAEAENKARVANAMGLSMEAYLRKKELAARLESQLLGQNFESAQRAADREQALGLVAHESSMQSAALQAQAAAQAAEQGFRRDESALDRTQRAGEFAGTMGLQRERMGEDSRQFDAGLGQREREFDAGLGFQREQFDYRKDQDAADPDKIMGRIMALQLGVVDPVDAADGGAGAPEFASYAGPSVGTQGLGLVGTPGGGGASLIDKYLAMKAGRAPKTAEELADETKQREIKLAVAEIELGKLKAAAEREANGELSASQRLGLMQQMRAEAEALAKEYRTLGMPPGEPERRAVSEVNARYEGMPGATALGEGAVPQAYRPPVEQRIPEALNALKNAGYGETLGKVYALAERQGFHADAMKNPALAGLSRVPVMKYGAQIGEWLDRQLSSTTRGLATEQLAQYLRRSLPGLSDAEYTGLARLLAEQAGQ